MPCRVSDKTRRVGGSPPEGLEIEKIRSVRGDEVLNRLGPNHVSSYC